MSKTLLNGVNELLKRVSVIAGDAGLLTSLTDSGRQPSIDVAVQVINEGNGELFTVSETPMSSELKEGTLTLVAGTRAYTHASDLVQMRYPLRDKTNSQRILEYPGGYKAMLDADIEQDDTGLPHYAAIRETDGKLHLDCAPTSAENGRIYTYQYDKDLVLAAAADTMPFSDAVFRAMVPAWAQLWKRERRGEFDEGLFRGALGQASRLLTQKQPRSDYSPR